MDILITETGSGGDIVFDEAIGDLAVTNDFTNQVYLALFGGNIYDSNGEQKNAYWGNLLIAQENQVISSFERSLTEVALNSSGLAIIKSSAESDLDFLKKYGKITVNISIPKINCLYLSVLIQAPNNVEQTVNILWNADTKQVILE